jgi:hypothetical protein
MTKKEKKIEHTVVCHCIQSGAAAAAISLPWGSILWPYAAFARVTLGGNAADLALEGDHVDEGEGKVPAHQADKEEAIEEFRVNTATDAAESSNEEHHHGEGNYCSEDGRTQRSEKKGRRLDHFVLHEFIYPLEHAESCQVI